MNTKFASSAVGLLLGTFTAAALAATPAGQPAAPATTTINVAGNPVPVLAGGLYDRFRSNPPLSVVAKESPNTDLSWFKTLKKTKVDIGFESYSPNFYYENSKVTMVYTADIDKLRALIPAKVLEQVQPLQVWPGRGLVALTAYAYHYCDNDSYNEIALSVVTNKPGEGNYGPLSLVGQSLDKNLWGYVFKLPVDTELAKVRGVVGYNLPKWKTRIDYRPTQDKVVFEVADAATGKTDFVIQSDKLKDVSKEASLSTQSFTNIGHDGQLTTGYSVARQLEHGTSLSQDSVQLKLGDGSFSKFIKSLDLGRMVQYQYVPNFQMALYAPEPLKKTNSNK
jgi:hypothetical protein